MQRYLTASIAALALAMSAGAANAAVLTFEAVMSGPNESPANASPGTGYGTVVIDTVANTMTLNVTFSGLTGTTSASHIHCCTAVAGASTAGVATTTPSFSGFPLGVTSGTFSNTLDLLAASSYNPAYVTANGGTTASAEAALVAGITSGKAYWNIHSSTFPGGEIRGFLTAVPEPATWAMLIVGFGMVGLGMRRRRQAIATA